MLEFCALVAVHRANLCGFESNWLTLLRSIANVSSTVGMFHPFFEVESH